jgi:hypothetical protein
MCGIKIGLLPELKNVIKYDIVVDSIPISTNFVTEMSSTSDKFIKVLRIRADEAFTGIASVNFPGSDDNAILKRPINSPTPRCTS